ncbi:nucleotidyl transferase AbiEii/AbiGii toxin family protein [Corynebacterium pseudodiphtheriticum]|uniref:nucleotidyl transferase AbiEii/AbiGii toxin family protein n=1 Tax=Corynebacterium pseudodiphtheriticum TaxID=37637 RepID=UPI00254A351C|nr:nucleotidyl transferase AbiEii/AbiGii toxin family protein [Corynebacterium pseudodiphtheriticum]MDK8775213.1 nucleotidyl transferase AbiEii/AbiGii toxin family protein [Corynebacterium pseudodiphtheriticum]
MSNSKLRNTHTQITAGLRQLAKDEGKNPNHVYNRFFREIFLAELMAIDDGWVIKGGTNLNCILPGARHTKDLDLYRQLNPTGHLEAAKNLVARMNGTRVGPYEFKVEHARQPQKGDGIENVPLRITTRIGARKFLEFWIDVSGDLQVPPVTSTTTVKRSDNLNIPFAPQTFQILSYPVENQLADKICAMYEMHEGRASTRFRDLYDITLIALNLEVDSEELALALKTQQQVRNMRLPLRFSSPSNEWPLRYPRFCDTPGVNAQPAKTPQN